MFWADKIEKELGENEIINDSKTPSGRVHVGSLRGVVLHYMIYKVLKEAGKNPTFLYGTDDYDPVDGLPKDMKEEWGKYMGLPLCNVPSPDPSVAKTFPEYYMNEFIEVFKGLGIEPKIYKMSDFYRSGKMNETIETLLNNEEIIREVYLSVSGSKKPATWHPFQVVCEKCGKIGTTLVHDFDGKEVEYTCEENMVDWAKGCGYRGKISPFDGNGKLPWKLEWVGKWKILGVTVEGAGKDHSSKGGSRDVSSEIYKRIFNGKAPYNVPYEFFLLGGRKMSSSGGLGATSKEVSELIPAELLRFLMTRYAPLSTIEFNPQKEQNQEFKKANAQEWQKNQDQKPIKGLSIPDLFDENDRCAAMYFDKETDDAEGIDRAFELAQINDEGLKKRYMPKFTTVATLLQIPGVDIEANIADLKGEALTDEDKLELKERIENAQKWLDRFAPENQKFQVQDSLAEGIKSAVTEDQKKFIKECVSIFDEERPGDEVHQMIYDATQTVGIKPAEGFKVMYQLFIAKNQGPRVGGLLAALDRNFVQNRLNEVL